MKITGNQHQKNRMEVKTMAWVGIDKMSCPKCGSNATAEIQIPTISPERKVYLKCYQCKQDTYWGTYTLVGNALVKVK